MRILLKYGYITIVSLNSKTVTAKDDSKVSLLFCSVMKTPEFEDHYQAFEKELDAKRAKFNSEQQNAPREESKREAPSQSQVPDAKLPAEASEPKSEGSSEAPVAPKSLSVESGEHSSEHDDAPDSQWWLKGLTEEDKKAVEDYGEPVIYM